MNKTALMALIGSFTFITTAHAGIFSKKEIVEKGFCISPDSNYQIQYEYYKEVSRLTGEWKSDDYSLVIQNAKTGETIKSADKRSSKDSILNVSFLNWADGKHIKIRLENSDSSIKTIMANCNASIQQRETSGYTRRVSKKIFLNIPKNLFVGVTGPYDALWAVDAYITKDGLDANLIAKFDVGVPKTECQITRYKQDTYSGKGDENIKVEMTQFLYSEHIAFAGQSANFWYFINCNVHMIEPREEDFSHIPDSEKQPWMMSIPVPFNTSRLSEAQILSTLKTNFPAKMIEIK